MRIGVQRKTVSRKLATELVEFSLLNPHHPNHSRRTLNRFLIDLSSSEDLIFDYHYHGERTLVAVLIDNIQNPSNSANLEVIGFKKGTPYLEIVGKLLQEAKGALPTFRSGIEFGVNQKSDLTEDWLNGHGFSKYYATFDMMKTSAHVAKARELPAGYEWQTLNNERFPEYYEILTAAFAKNLETSIPSLEEMRSRFQTSKFPASLLCEGGHVIGFSSVSVDDADAAIGEVHMIGLHLSQRQKGLGSILLSEALSNLARHGVTKVRLTVAAANEGALHLYKKFGFSVINSDICYRYPGII